MNEANTLELQQVSGVDGSEAAVAGIALAVPSGRSLALLGPPHAGKSSLLRLIAGFGSLSGGRILFNGYDLHRVPPHRRPFGLLTGQDTLFPHLTVAGNVAYGLKAQGLSRTESERRVAEVLDLVEARTLLKALPDSLNRGERQKVALARTLAVQPHVLLLDDPFGALDPLESGRLMAMLTQLQRRVALTLLFATTDGTTAMAYADTLAVLAEGRLVQTGAPAELYDRPDHALTARLTGPVNLLTGLGMRRGNRAGGPVAAGSSATALALRPDRIDLHLTAPTGPAVEGYIERIAFGAGGLTAHVMLDGRGERLAARVDTRRLDSSDLPEGRRVWCTWEDGDARLVRL